jgi:hypothetical protein
VTALYIILGIILFFAAVLSIPVVLNLEYTDSVRCSVSWLFLKFNLIPMEKKDKPEKEKKPKPEKPKEEKKEEKPKEKKDNFLKVFYNNQGVSGIIELVSNCASALGKLSKGFIHSLYVRKLRIKIGVTDSDAAATAIKYGKICAALYPPLGFICSTMHVKNYKVNVFADYCGEKTTGEFETRINLIPLIAINAGIAFAFRLVIQLAKVAISNIKSASKKQKSTVKGGQEQ